MSPEKDFLPTQDQEVVSDWIKRFQKALGIWPTATGIRWGEVHEILNDMRAFAGEKP